MTEVYPEGRCWTVQYGPGRWDRTFVWATDVPSALAACHAKVGQVGRTARLTFPWLTSSLGPDASDNLSESVGRPDSESSGEAQPKHPRMAEVVAWLRTYSGRNQFVLDVQAKVRDGRQATGRNVGARKAYRLSDRQVEALAKVKDREGERKQPGPGVSGLNLWAVLPYGTTRAAAENERGTLSFVKIDKVKDGRWADFVFVKAIVGGSEDMRLGMQGPDKSEYTGQWPQVLRNVAADVQAAVARYGLELGVCGVCNSPLTNEQSRREGIGPVCKAKLGSVA